MDTAAEALRQALQHHQAGRLGQAELLYRRALQADPRRADALHGLGMIASQRGQNDLAADLIGQALRINPGHAPAHNNLGVVLKDLGRLQEAEASCRRALRLHPGYAEAHNNLGVTLWMQGRLEEAAASYEQALGLRPDYAAAHNNRGLALRDLGRLDEAVASYERALHLNPNYAEALTNLGIASKERGRLESVPGELLTGSPALGWQATSISTIPQALELAVKHHQAGQLQQAEQLYRQILQGDPQQVDALRLLGVIAHQVGRHDLAIDYMSQALRLNPGHAEAHNSLAVVYKAQGRVEEAVAHYREALRLKPDFAEAHNNLAAVLKDQGRLEEAVASYEQALRLKPHYAEAQMNVGSVRKDQGRLDEAVAAYRAGLALKPGDAKLHSNLVYVLIFHPAYDATAILEECRRWNQQHAEPLAKFIQPHANSPDPDRRLRIGYVSPDFREHACSFFTIPLLSSHDHRQFEIYCYADVTRPDAVTERHRGHADVWRSTAGLSDRQLADLVRGDRIDILVDLTMHMADNRLPVFARKPAPVQVTWLAYPGTTGLSAIDYRLTDPYLDPAGLFDAFYSEESVRLPETFWCYDPLTDQPPVNALPGRPDGVITFGCLNNFCKVNQDCLALWARVLRAVPQSRMLLLAPPGEARERVAAKFGEEGIVASRIEFTGRAPRPEYLRLYHRVDLGLDPVPYNGHTTSLDAFWMGVPTITLVSNKTTFGRAGWSQLCNLGLKELAAETPEQYVALAAQLAGDLPRLRELRGTLRQRMRQSPLMDAGRFARHVEQAYRHMWRRWCGQRRSPEPCPGTSG
jgi:protein O-GlcNAc transferase